VRVQLRQYDTPFDAVLSVAVAGADDGKAVVAAGFVSSEDLAVEHQFDVQGDDLGPIDDAIRAWLSGDFEALRRVSVRQQGSEFQHRVWDALSEVTSGMTCTYGELAAAAGSPGAARAVGSACAANSVAPFVPCHRVVPSGGGVGEYGYGRELKSALLDSESEAQ
jgi:methylated-DNA-[protein]-cysteine S-methyltransferase